MDYKQKMVREFHEKNDQLVNDVPQNINDLPDDVVSLRVKLHAEEFVEMQEALIEGDLKEFVDGAGDLLYVVYGTCNSLGVDLDEVFKEIHRTNMNKSGRRRDDGKIVKEDDFEEPDIEGVLEDMKNGK